MALDEIYAGPWKRALGHADNKVYIHPSAATAERPQKTLISCPRGWYDAGDYTKYIVNSGITCYTLLAIYEHFREYADSLVLHIPENRNGLPDLLDEILWNLRWMLTMQDPNDGGVYNKLTSPEFCGFVMPDQDKLACWVVQKSTAATLDFAAVTAQAFRVYRDHLPSFADSCLSASLAAWNWARLHPDELYDQNAMNALFSSRINTGAYGDSNVSDEWDWSAMELFVTTGQDSFLQTADAFDRPQPAVPGWGSVRTLGFFTLLHHRKNIPAGSVDTLALKNNFFNFANGLRSEWMNSAYGVAMGKSNGDFDWGSNSVAANQGMALIQAFLVSRDSTYLWAALSNLDYMLGRNATTYCFITGWGGKSPMNIHHRQSGSDRVKEPVPGFLAGGPNPGQQDGCSGYPSDLPARSYVDAQCSYASNENAINWNAPFSYLACAMEALLSPAGLPDKSSVKHRKTPVPDCLNLVQAYPNPFNANAVIQFSLARPAWLNMAVYDAAGRLVSEPVLKTRFAAGMHQVPFPGGGLPSGIYMIRIQAGDEAKTGKMVLVK